MKQAAKALVSVASALCLLNPATGSFIYDVTVSNGAFDGADTHQQWMEPTILTASTPVTTFLINTSSGREVTSLWLGPDEYDQCLHSQMIVIGGPCLVVDSATTGFAIYVGMPAFESVGTFTSGDINNSATIRIWEIAEPASVLLLLPGLSMLLIGFRAAKRGQAAPVN